MEIKTGKYKTRGGEVAVVLCVDAPVTFKRIIGYVICEVDDFNFASSRSWQDNGMCYSSFESENDLVEYLGA